jgi:site-specific DNA-cytosine methylase
VSQRKGQDDDRYFWPEMGVAVLHAESLGVIAENVPGLIGPALDAVLSDLEAAGYECGTVAVPACAFKPRGHGMWNIRSPTY